MNKFSQENNTSNKEGATCCQVPINKRWHKNKLFIVSVGLSGIYFLSYLIPLLVPFRESLLLYIKKIWLAVSLGLFLGGIVEHFIPQEYISRTLAKPKKKTIFYSVILGFFMSTCSHGILALSIQLHKKGASNPAVVSFLLASPWANLPLTIMLIGFFGLKAFYIIFSAIIIAIITGLTFQFLESKGLIEKNKNSINVDDTYSIVGDFKNRLHNYRFTKTRALNDIKGIFKGILSLGDMVLWWIMIGIGLASLTGAYIPGHIFHRYMGPNLAGLLVTLLLATILEVCSEGTAPLAFEIFRQTGALGNSFIFLMAGVVTDYTEIGLLWHNVGRKTAIWLPIIAVPQVVALGILANLIF